MPSWRPAVTTMFVPGGVCASALSIRIRMICATLSGSSSASTRRPSRRSSRCESWRASAGWNSLVTARASDADVGRLGAQLERPGLELRQVEQVGGELLQPPDLVAHLGEERLRASRRRGPRPASSSRKPPSEKIGVRSSCDAVAMKRLRASSSCAELALHVVQRERELARARRRSRRRTGPMRSPAATRRAVRSRRLIRCARRVREQQPAGEREQQRDGARDRDARRARTRRCRRRPTAAPTKTIDPLDVVAAQDRAAPPGRAGRSRSPRCPSRSAAGARPRPRPRTAGPAGARRRSSRR